MPEQVDYVERTLRWLKQRKLFAAVMILGLIASATASLSDSVSKLWRQIREATATSPLSITAALYAKEIAVTKGGAAQVAFSEIRDLSSNCSLFRIQVPSSPPGPGLSVSEDGARAEAQLKLGVRNFSPQRQTNVQIGIASTPFPFLFGSLTTTPNIAAELSRPPPSQGIESPYLIRIAAIDPDDLAVITLSAPLSRKSAPNAFSTKLDISVLFARSDQYPSIKDLPLTNVDAMDLLLGEGARLTGRRSYSPGFEFKTLAKGAPPRDIDLGFLPSAAECPHQKQ